MAKKKTEIIKQKSLEEIKEYLVSLLAEEDPKKILKLFEEKRIEFLKADKKERDKIGKEIEIIGNKAMQVVGLDTHYPIAEIASERERPLVIELCNQLTKEYDCKTASEKVLVHLIGSCYARMIVVSRYIVSTTKLGHTTPNLNNFLSVMSKELDRSNRQLISAISTLKHLKTPELKVNIKTNNAFVAQNQQLNNSNEYENNKQ